VEVITIGGLPCEILRWPARDVNAICLSDAVSDACEILRCQTRQILVLPGNPGVVEYYRDFCASLWERKDRSVEVVCLGLIGHAGQRLYPLTATYTMHDQVAHIGRYIQEHCAGKQVDVLGHSIGAWFALEALRNHPEVVRTAVGVYPYITNNPTSAAQNFLSFLVHRRFLVFFLAVVAEVNGRLAAPLRTMLLRPITGGFEMDPRAATLTARAMTRYEAFNNMCFMGRTELDGLQAPPDWDFLRANASKVHFVFNRDDYWAPLWLKEETQQKVPALATYLDTEHDHMFCCHEKASSDIASLVSAIL